MKLEWRTSVKVFFRITELPSERFPVHPHYKFKMDAKIFLLILFSAVLSVTFSSPLQNSFEVSDDRVPQCYQPMKNGLCLAYIPSFYYDPSSDTCKNFIYGGCGGNANRFFTVEQCMATCAGFAPEENEFKLNLDDVQSDPSDPCKLPSKTGPCRARLPRFYFNGDECETFMYGGCQGNENNFKSVEECQERCGRKTSEETAEVQPKSTSEEVSEEVADEQPQATSEEQPQGTSEEQPQQPSEEVSRDE